MADLIMDPAAWAEMEFGDCDLGDLRRTRRAVRFAAQVARNPGASTPGQAKEWKDLKAAYRLLDMDDVTFEALAKPHWLRTRNPPRGTWLLLCGQTLIERAADTASRKKKKAAGETTGFILHSSLMVDRTGRSIIGLAGQVTRRPAGSAAVSSAARPASPVAAWGQLIDEIGCRRPAASWSTCSARTEPTLIRSAISWSTRRAASFGRRGPLGKSSPGTDRRRPCEILPRLCPWPELVAFPSQRRSGAGSEDHLRSPLRFRVHPASEALRGLDQGLGAALDSAVADPRAGSEASQGQEARGMVSLDVRNGGHSRSQPSRPRLVYPVAVGGRVPPRPEGGLPSGPATPPLDGSSAGRHRGVFRGRCATAANESGGDGEFRIRVIRGSSGS